MYVRDPDLNLVEISRAIWPQVVLMLVVLMVVTYVPAFSLALVR